MNKFNYLNLTFLAARAKKRKINMLQSSCYLPQPVESLPEALGEEVFLNSEHLDFRQGIKRIYCMSTPLQDPRQQRVIKYIYVSAVKWVNIHSKTLTILISDQGRFCHQMSQPLIYRKNFGFQTYLDFGTVHRDCRPVIEAVN